MESIPAAGFNSADLPRATGTKKLTLSRLMLETKHLTLPVAKLMKDPL